MGLPSAIDRQSPQECTPPDLILHSPVLGRPSLIVDCRFRAAFVAGADNSILLQPVASGLSGGGVAALGLGPCSTP